MPREPRLFSLAHELKHHYLDQAIIMNGVIKCGDYNATKEIEVAAEVFAAEFIYPEDDMLEDINKYIKNNKCSPEDVVYFKKKSPAIVSYQFLVKRFEWFGLCKRREYNNVKFRNLEEKMFGTPFYKQPWFKEQRTNKSKEI